MTQGRMFYRLVLLLVLLICSIISTFGQNRTVSIDLNVSATAINRFIAAQTFPTLSGETEHEGYLYDISISKPIVQLNSGSATVQFTINANTDVGNYSFNVQPTITIPSLSISATQVIATLQQFDALINSRSDIPTWLKPIIISGYNNMNLVMYPSKLIDYANSAVPEYINVQVVDIGLAFAVVPGAIKFTFSVVALGTAPVFTSDWMKRGVGQLSVRFGGNVATSVKQVRIYNVYGSELYNNGSLNVSVPNDGYCSQIDIPNYTSVTTYYIVVLFHSPYGEYVRRYSFSFNTATYNTWFPTTYASGIN